MKRVKIFVLYSLVIMPMPVPITAIGITIYEVVMVKSISKAESFSAESGKMVD